MTGPRGLDLIHALIAWEHATSDGTETIGDVTVTLPTGTYVVQLTQTRADRMRWSLLADTRALTTPQPDQG